MNAPKPTALKVLTGNPGKRPLNKHEPKPDPADPKRPAGMSQRAKNTWNRVLPKLRKIGVLTVIDGEMLARYCIASAEFWEASLYIQKHGQTYVDDNGKPRARPEIGIADKCGAVMQRIEVEFGMSPSSRTRIRTEPFAQVDEFEAFLKADRA